MAMVPARLVPIELPSIRLPLALPNTSTIPLLLFPESTLPVPGVVPPMVLSSPLISTPLPKLTRAVESVTSGCSHQIALDDVAVTTAVNLDGIAVVSRDEVASSRSRRSARTVFPHEAILRGSSPMPLGNRLLPVESVADIIAGNHVGQSHQRSIDLNPFIVSGDG